MHMQLHHLLAKHAMRDRTVQVNARPYAWPHDASFSPHTTALVVIDMQRDFCEDGGYLDYQGYHLSLTQKIIPELLSTLTACRTLGLPIFFTRESHRPDLSDLTSRELFRSRNNPTGRGVGDRGPFWRFLVRGEPGCDIVSSLEPAPGEVIIDKPGKGAFTNTDFDLLLRARGIKNLIISGVTTDVCVSTTMREASDRGYDCLLLEDCCASGDQKLHEAAVEMVKVEGGIFGVTATGRDLVIAIDHLKPLPGL